MKILILFLRTIRHFLQQLFSEFINLLKYKTLQIDGKKALYIPTDFGKLLVPSHKFDDVIYAHVKKNLIYDRFIADLIIKYYLKSANKGLVLDVGANIGQMSLYVTNSIVKLNQEKLNRPVLISIEAEPFLYKLLEMNVKNFGYSSEIEYHDIVAWSDQRFVNFPVPDLKKFSNWGSYGVEPSKNSKDRLLKTSTIDSIVNNRNVSIIKMDIQGSEFNALQGCLKTVAESKPTIIFEYEYKLSKILGVAFQDFLSLIESYNYKFLDMSYPNFIIGPK